jgi:hypothetical protein
MTGEPNSLRDDVPRDFDGGNDDLVAVREAVAQWRAGDPGMPIEAAFESVRRSQGAEGSE